MPLIYKAGPATAFVAPEYPDNAWRAFRAMLDDHPGDWLPVFDRRTEAEKRGMAPMLCGLVITQAMRQQDFATMHDAIRMARQFGLPAQPLQSAAVDLLRILSAALQASTPDAAQT